MTQEMDIDTPNEGGNIDILNNQKDLETSNKLSLRDELLYASINKDINDVNPIVAIPYSSQVYSMTFTKGPKWMFTGGDDGFIRKFDFFQSVSGKSLLTVSQKHQLVDSIQFNGVLCSYWENELPIYKSTISSSTDVLFEPKISPVYSLCSENYGNWILSGLDNGSITLQSIKSNEGSIQWYFHNSNDQNVKNKNLRHSMPVSKIITNTNQTNFLSGSWDKKILKWDLNTGKNLNYFINSTGQISSLEYRPIIGSSIDWKINSNDNDSDVDSLFNDDDDEEEEEEEDIKNDDNDDDEDKKSKKPIDDNIEMKRDIEKLQRDAIQTGKYEGVQKSDDIFLSASIDGIVSIWDSRITERDNRVMQIQVPNGTPPWCMSSTWSVDGDTIFIGRRNSTVEQFDIRKTNELLDTFKFPTLSGSVSCITTMPNKRYILCGSQDNIRLYDLESKANNTNQKNRSIVPFSIVAGHQGGIVSSLYVDPTCRFLVSASGNRGWQGKASDCLFIYEFL